MPDAWLYHRPVSYGIHVPEEKDLVYKKIPHDRERKQTSGSSQKLIVIWEDCQSSMSIVSPYHKVTHCSTAACYQQSHIVALTAPCPSHSSTALL